MFWFSYCYYTQNVFYREYKRDDPLRYIKCPEIFKIIGGHTFQHHQDDTKNNHYQQGDIKEFACGGICFIDDLMKLFLPFGWIVIVFFFQANCSLGFLQI